MPKRVPAIPGMEPGRLPFSPVIEANGFTIESVRDFQTFDTLMPAFPMQRIDARRKPSTSATF